jgi:replicative DNA helicase
MAPISDTYHEEEQIKREMLLQDGDMSFMSSDSDDLDWIMKYRNGELEIGLTSGNRILDKNFVFKREFNMISGHSSIGKTTFMLYLMVSASVNHDWRWVIYSSENSTASVKMRLMQFATGKAINDMGKHEITSMMRWVSDHFVVIDSDKTLSYIDVMLYTEKVARHRSIDGLLIDPYNSLRVDLSATRGVGVHEYHYEAASEFLMFSKRMNMAVWVNAHSVTSAQRSKGDDGLPAAPDAPDTEHGGKWVNRCDGFIVLHRKIHHPDVNKRREVEMHIKKVRNTETGGEVTAHESPHIFKLSSNACNFEMSGPFPRLFHPINIQDVEKQLGIN